ncbi:MAG: phosphatidylglycerophosphatase A, partial [Romboutsia sp.]|nr:phosphatidylglycerophosphatase A [Romboutsia sp.]
MSVIKKYTIDRLLQRGVSIEDIAEVAFNYLTTNKNLNINLDECINTLLDILNKREILHKIILGIDIDEIVERNLFESPIMDVIKGDDGLFGVDELFGINIADLYGAIGYNTFGYFDKTKPGIIDRLDTSKDTVNTFLDDLVCGLAAAISSKLLHNYMETSNLNTL